MYGMPRSKELSEDLRKKELLMLIRLVEVRKENWADGLDHANPDFMTQLVKSLYYAPYYAVAKYCARCL